MTNYRAAGLKRSLSETVLKSVLSDCCKLLPDYSDRTTELCLCCSPFLSDILPGSCFLEKTLLDLSNGNDATANIHETGCRSAFTGVPCSTRFYSPIPVSVTGRITCQVSNKRAGIEKFYDRIIESEKTLVIISNTFHFTEKHYHFTE